MLMQGKENNMAKFNIRDEDPDHYEKIKAEQERLKKQCDCMMRVARICPYCRHKITVACKGSHGFETVKCPNCGEDVIFPPLSFRIAR
jgi:hypothetical protein